MTPKRLIAVLLFFFAVAFAVAHLETQKVRYAGRIARLNRQIVQISYQQWDAQASLAKLCSPAELLQRTSGMALGTIPPRAIVPAEGLGAAEELAASY